MSLYLSQDICNEQDAKIECYTQTGASKKPYQVLRIGEFLIYATNGQLQQISQTIMALLVSENLFDAGAKAKAMAATPTVVDPFSGASVTSPLA